MPGAVGVLGCLCPLPPLMTPAVANKFSKVGAGSVSIGSSGGSPGGGYLGGGLVRDAGAPTLLADSEAEATVLHPGHPL